MNVAFRLYQYFWTEGFDSERTVIIAASDLEHANSLLVETKWRTDYGAWRVLSGCTSETAGIKFDSWAERNNK